MTYDVYSLSGSSIVVTVKYNQNDESNPWKYSSGGTPLSGYQDKEIFYTSSLSDSLAANLGGGYHNVVEVDIGFLLPDSFLAHYTYGCGNDNLIGSVPEPSNMFLLGTGILGLVAIGRKRYFK
jgi:hypothetical protein